MLHYVHQLVANCVFLLFGGVQVVYSRLLELFHWKQLPAAAENACWEQWEWTKTVRLWVGQLNELKLAVKLRKVKGSCRFKWYCWDCFHIVIWYIVIIKTLIVIYDSSFKVRERSWLQLVKKSNANCRTVMWNSSATWLFTTTPNFTPLLSTLWDEVHITSCICTERRHWNFNYM